MASISNQLNRRIMINLKGGKNVDLLAKSSLEIKEEDISSPHLQAFIKAGKVKIESIQRQRGGEGEMAPHRDESIEKKRRPL